MENKYNFLINAEEISLQHRKNSNQCPLFIIKIVFVFQNILSINILAIIHSLELEIGDNPSAEPNHYTAGSVAFLKGVSELVITLHTRLCYA